ncbi:MAG: division plane positioning ATPase MipZ [Stellaceae bacterium]
MPNIVIAQPKGGVGKSTSANILMTSLARRGATVTGIDADRNRPQIKWALRAGVRLPQYPQHQPSILPSLSIIEETAEESLIDTIQAASAASQFVIVDLEGVASQAATFAISQADMVVIPCGPSYLDAVEAAAVLKVVKACEQMSRQPIRIPAAVIFTKTSPAIRPDTLREIERQFERAQTPIYDVRLHTRSAYAAIFSRGTPLHELNPSKVHNLKAAIENAEAFMAETIRRLDQAQTGAERAVA